MDTTKNFYTFEQLFWKKIREEMRIEILREQKPKKGTKLYELQPDEMDISLD